MDEDVDFSGWELPPLQDDPDREPPPEREYFGGVWIGSDLTGLRHAGTGVLDLGEFVCNELASVRPTVVALAELGSTDFGALSQKERVDALRVLEQHRGEPRAEMPPRPPRQTPRRLAGQTQPGRHHHLDQPPRPRIHQPPTLTLENPWRIRLNSIRSLSEASSVYESRQSSNDSPRTHWSPGATRHLGHRPA